MLVSVIILIDEIVLVLVLVLFFFFFLIVVVVVVVVDGGGVRVFALKRKIVFFLFVFYTLRKVRIGLVGGC